MRYNRAFNSLAWPGRHWGAGNEKGYAMQLTTDVFSPKSNKEQNENIILLQKVIKSTSASKFTIVQTRRADGPMLNFMIVGPKHDELLKHYHKEKPNGVTPKSLDSGMFKDGIFTSETGFLNIRLLRNWNLTDVASVAGGWDMNQPIKSLGVTGVAFLEKAETLASQIKAFKFEPVSVKAERLVTTVKEELETGAPEATVLRLHLKGLEDLLRGCANLEPAKQKIVELKKYIGNTANTAFQGSYREGIEHFKKGEFDDALSCLNDAVGALTKIDSGNNIAPLGQVQSGGKSDDDRDLEAFTEQRKTQSLAKTYTEVKDEMEKRVSKVLGDLPGLIKKAGLTREQLKEDPSVVGGLVSGAASAVFLKTKLFPKLDRGMQKLLVNIDKSTKMTERVPLVEEGLKSVKIYLETFERESAREEERLKKIGKLADDEGGGGAGRVLLLADRYMRYLRFLNQELTELHH